MAHHPTQCRFCKKPITLEIDNDYVALGMPFDFILELAACDRCAELRERRSRLETKIGKACTFIEFLGDRDAKQRAIMRNILLSLARKYGKLILDWHNELGDFDSPIIAAKLADDPSKWGEHLSEYWRLFPEWKLRQTQSPLPYKDA